MAVQKAISGASARLYRDGTVLIGWATGVSANEQTALSRVDVLGDVDSQDLEPVRRTVSVQADFVRIKGKSLGEMGVVPRGGTVEVLAFPEISLDLYDQVSGKFLARVIGARCESQGWRVDANSVMTSNLAMQARRLVDESGA